jgi:hypothetical protein
MMAKKEPVLDEYELAYKKRVLVLVNELYKIRKGNRFRFFGKPKHQLHYEAYNELENLARNRMHLFAKMVADGEIDYEFEGLLSERPGAVAPLYVGVIEILLNSSIPTVKSGAEWYMRVHYPKYGR